VGGYALAKQGSDDAKGKSKVSEKFEDMSEYNWGLGDVVRLSVKGVFQGRSESQFAPGAAITRQEMAVAAVRLAGREAEAKGMAQADLTARLAGLTDREAIADWAKPSVALLIKLGAMEPKGAFQPTQEATRLDVAVLLVKLLGYEAEAQAKMSATLGFTDSQQIPASLVGYVAAAVDHGIITGYDNGSFRPERAVKRVEMAVMMGRADRQMERSRADEFKGTLQAVTANSLTILVGERSHTFQLAAEGAVFLNNSQAALADLKAGMKIEVKLNAGGEALYVEAESRQQAKQEFRGQITGLTPAAGAALAVVTIDGKAYTLSPVAVIRLKGDAVGFADLQVGDRVEASLVAGLLVRLNLERESRSAQPGTPGAPGKVELVGTVSAVGATSLTLGENTYTLAPQVEVYLKGNLVALSEVRVGDLVEIKVEGGLVTRIKLERESSSRELIPIRVELVGTVSAVGASSLTVGETTFALAPDVEILWKGKAITLADLKVGDRVEIRLEADLITRIKLEREKPENSLDDN